MTKFTTIRSQQRTAADICSFELACGHTAERPWRTKPYARLVCEVCHPSSPKLSRPTRMHTSARYLTFDGVRQARGDRAMFKRRRSGLY